MDAYEYSELLKLLNTKLNNIKGILKPDLLNKRLQEIIELESAQDRQREERQAVDTAADAADRSTEAVENSQRTTEEIKSIERTDRELIENCQRIIQRIRERGRTESKD